MKNSLENIKWGYIGQFFSFGTSILILPLLLRFLSKEEIGYNYLLVTISGLVGLLDFGFSVQFSRNFAYVFGGAQKLSREGVVITQNGIADINYFLLKTLISASKVVYQRISLLSLLILTSIGTAYVYKATSGFKSVNNSLEIWILFSISVYFNIYFTYLNTILQGSGRIAELNKITIAGRLAQLFLNILFLFLGLGLFGIVLGNFTYPFLTRFLLIKQIFNKELSDNLSLHTIHQSEITNTFDILWFNTKKLGLNFLGAYLINKSSLFLAGLYLSLADIASFGLMLQTYGIVLSLSSNVFNVFQPKIALARVKNDKELIMDLFSKSMSIFYSLFIIGALAIIYLGPFILKIIHSNISLPSKHFLLVYSITLLLEHNHSFFSTLIATGNKVPFVKSALISGIAILLGIVLWFQVFGANYWAMIIVPGIVQLSYNNWKWPLDIFKEFNTNLITYLESIVYQYKSFILRIFKVVQINKFN